MEQFNWTVKHEEDFNEKTDYLKTIIQASGVENVTEFLNPAPKHKHDPFLLENMNKGLEVYQEALASDKTIFIKVDSDTDGYTAAAYFLQATLMISPNQKIEYKLNYKKEHGLMYEDVADLENLGLIVVIDAGSGYQSYEEYQSINKNLNVPILILDHHEINTTITTLDNVTLINCQDQAYPNSDLAGVGVVHKFFEAFATLNPDYQDIPNQFLDLVALGMVADSMGMRVLENRFYVLEGLTHKNRYNSFITELGIKYEKDMKLGHTIESYGWVIAPKINGTIRFGKPEEQLNLFRALIGEEEYTEYQPRRKSKLDPIPPKETHSLQKTMARVVGNVKQRQDTATRKSMQQIELNIAPLLEESPILLIDAQDAIKGGSIGGLVANKIASKYKRPTLILFKTQITDKETEITKDVYRGSARGYVQGEIPDLKQYLTETELFNYCEGHANAFGASIDATNLKKVQQLCRTTLKMPSKVTTHVVDYHVNGKLLTNQAVKAMAGSYRLWGRGIDKPLFIIDNISMSIADVQAYGVSNGFIRFKYNGISYIKKYCTKNEFSEFTHINRNVLGKDERTINVVVIGSFETEEFNGEYIPQVKIKHFYSELREVNKSQDIQDMSIDDIF